MTVAAGLAAVLQLEESVAIAERHGQRYHAAITAVQEEVVAQALETGEPGLERHAEGAAMHRDDETVGADTGADVIGDVAGMYMLVQPVDDRLVELEDALAPRGARFRRRNHADRRSG